MKHPFMVRTLAPVLLCTTAIAGCSGASEQSSVQTASTDEVLLGPQEGESMFHRTPAERRLDWVRRPFNSQTAAVDARLAGEGSTAKAR